MGKKLPAKMATTTKTTAPAAPAPPAAAAAAPPAAATPKPRSAAQAAQDALASARAANAAAKAVEAGLMARLAELEATHESRFAVMEEGDRAFRADMSADLANLGREVREQGRQRQTGVDDQFMRTLVRNSEVQTRILAEMAERSRPAREPAGRPALARPEGLWGVPFWAFEASLNMVEDVVLHETKYLVTDARGYTETKRGTMRDIFVRELAGTGQAAIRGGAAGATKMLTDRWDADVLDADDIADEGWSTRDKVAVAAAVVVTAVATKTAYDRYLGAEGAEDIDNVYPIAGEGGI